MAVSDWNYAITGSANVQIGIPAQIGFQHNSNQVNAKLSDQFFFSLDHKQVQNSYADKILDKLGVDSLVASQLHLLKTLQEKENHIISTLSELKHQGIQSDEEVMGTAEQHGNLLSNKSGKTLTDSNLAIKDRAKQTTRSPMQHYASTLMREKERLRLEIANLQSQIELPSETVEVLSKAFSSEEIIAQYGRHYLSAKENILSSIKQFQTGRFSSRQNALFAHGLPITGGQLGLGIQGHTVSGFYGSTQILQSTPGQASPLTFSAGRITGFSYARERENEQITLDFSNISFEDAEGIAQNHKFLGIQYQWVETEGDGLVQLNVGGINLMGPTTQQWYTRSRGEVRLSRSFFDRRISAYAQVEYVGSDFIDPSNPWLINGSANGIAGIGYSPNKLPIRVSVEGRHQTRNALLGEGSQQVILNQLVLRNEVTLFKSIHVSGSIAPFVKTGEQHRTTQWQKSLSVAHDWRLDKINLLTSAIYTDQALELVSGVDSVYSFTCTTIQWEESIRISAIGQMGIEGSFFTYGNQPGNSIGGNAAIHIHHPNLRIGFSARHYTNHPFMRGWQYQSNIHWQSKNIQASVNGMRRSDVVAWVGSPYTFSASIKYQIP